MEHDQPDILELKSEIINAFRPVEQLFKIMSATGAAGMPGSLEEAAKMGMDFGKARSHFKQQVRGKQPEEQAVIVKKTWADVAQKMSKLRSDEAGFAVILGDMAICKVRIDLPAPPCPVTNKGSPFGQKLSIRNSKFAFDLTTSNALNVLY